MLYNIEVKFKDGTITQFDRRSRFKPDNVDRLHDRIYYDMRDYGRIKSITSIPVNSFQSLMLFVSGKSPNLSLTYRVYDFFTDSYEIASDVEIFHTDLSDDNAVGFTEVNGQEQFIQIHNDLTEDDYVTTVLHELVHVVQNEQGITADNVREDQAYHMEKVLFKEWCASLQTVH